MVIFAMLCGIFKKADAKQEEAERSNKIIIVEMGSRR